MTKHSQQHSAHNPDPMAELKAMEADTFAHRHKTLIWVVIIGLVVMLPIVFGAMALLGAL